MNWIIRNTSKLKFHTNLDVLLKPLEIEAKRFRWLISDLEINTSEMEKLPINHEKDWFLISSEEMDQIRKTNTQIVWGTFSAIDKDLKFKVTEEKLPYADGNSELWINRNLQIKESEIEIIAWDSTFTIVKFADKSLSDKFKKFFNEAIELEKYKWK